MNIATALKSEISRVARKEVRAEVSALKKASSKYRSDIADLKRRIAELERLAGKPGRGRPKKLVVGPEGAATTVTRYSAKNVAALRKKLDLSAADFGLLLGVTGPAVYLWEQGKSRPRPRNMPAIAALRALSKKAALGQLAALKQ